MPVHTWSQRLLIRDAAASTPPGTALHLGVAACRSRPLAAVPATH